MDSRPKVQPTKRSHGHYKEKSARMPGSKKKYLSPNVMGRPSLHTHMHSPSAIARVIKVLALTSCFSPKWWNAGEEAVRVCFWTLCLQTGCWWIERPLRNLLICRCESCFGVPGMLVWPALLLPLAGSVMLWLSGLWVVKSHSRYNPALLRKFQVKISVLICNTGGWRRQ